MNDDDELLEKSAACAFIGGSQSPIHFATLYRGVKSGKFPRPIKIGPGISRWRKSELREAIEKLALERP